MVNISLKPDQLQTLRDLLGEKRAWKAAAGAIQGTITASIKQIGKQVATKLNIDIKGALGDKSRPVLDQHKVRRKKADMARDPSGKLLIWRRPTRAIKFLTADPKTPFRPSPAGGFSVKFQKDKPPIVFSRGFVGTLPYKQKDKASGVVFDNGTRTVAALFRTTKNRTPISQIYGPSVLSLIGADTLTSLGREQVEKISQIYMKKMEQAIGRLLGIKAKDKTVLRWLDGEAEFREAA